MNFNFEGVITFLLIVFSVLFLIASFLVDKNAGPDIQDPWND